jgi:hypothetical protein
MSLGGGFLMIKSRSLAEQQRERAAGDYSVTVDRSGMYIHGSVSLPIMTIVLTHNLGGGI